MNKAEAKRVARELIGGMVLAAPYDVIENASMEFETEEDEQRVYDALIELANSMMTTRVRSR